MLEISNTEKFNRIVKESLDKSKNFPRWQNAINKAVTQINLQPEFITWMPETKSIVIWNQETNRVHAANGVCDCVAFEKGFPCFHRAMARLIRLYIEAESKPVEKSFAERLREQNNAPYLKNTVERKVERIGGVRI